jgi:hypothetical protein
MLILFPLSSGCRKKGAVSVTAPVSLPLNHTVVSAPKAITPEIPVIPVPKLVTPPTIPKATAPPNSFDLGEASFRARKYANAARSYEAYLQKNPEASDLDLALFHLGLSLALANTSAKNMSQAEQTLKRLVTEFPGSPYREPAEAILQLQSQVEKLKTDLREKDAKFKLLSEELQKLKDIDLQRRPSAPPY